MGVDIKHGKKAVLIYHPEDQSVTTAVDYVVDESFFPARVFDQRWHPDFSEQYHQMAASDQKSVPQLEYKAPRDDDVSGAILPQDAGLAGGDNDLTCNVPGSAGVSADTTSNHHRSAGDPSEKIGRAHV